MLNVLILLVSFLLTPTLALAGNPLPVTCDPLAPHWRDTNCSNMQRGEDHATQSRPDHRNGNSGDDDRDDDHDEGDVKDERERDEHHREKGEHRGNGEHRDNGEHRGNGEGRGKGRR